MITTGKKNSSAFFLGMTSSIRILQIKDLVKTAMSKTDFQYSTHLNVSKSLEQSITLVSKSQKRGRSLKSLGLILIALPEPATSIFGIPIYLAGKLMEQKSSTIGIKEIIMLSEDIKRDLSSF
jgi:hypothetical protein